jgi:hypothetical protein
MKMALSKVRKHSRERAGKRDKGHIYGVIDDLIAPSFAKWIAARRDQACTNTVTSLEGTSEKLSRGNREEADLKGIS